MLPVSDEAKRTCHLAVQTGLDLLLYLSLAVFTFVTSLRAYEEDNIPLLVYMVFFYTSYFAFKICLDVYFRLPEGDNSLKKKLLRFTLWFLPSANLLGSAILVNWFMNFTLILPMYCSAFVPYTPDPHQKASNSAADQKSSSNKHDLPTSDNIV